jgi:hypothetical protein
VEGGRNVDGKLEDAQSLPSPFGRTTSPAYLGSSCRVGPYVTARPALGCPRMQAASEDEVKRNKQPLLPQQKRRQWEVSSRFHRHFIICHGVSFSLT